MRIPTLTRALLWSSIVLGLWGAQPCLAATAAWSPRSSAIPGHVWTRAGWIRTGKHVEIAPTKSVHHRAAPPYATSRASTANNRYLSEAQPQRQTPSRDRVQIARSLLARLRTTAVPDRRARTAALAALAAIFYEAHAPPSLS